MKSVSQFMTVIFTALMLALGFTLNANAALDFTALTGAVDATTIVAALTAIAAIKMAPGVAKWGFNKVIGWFR